MNSAVRASPRRSLLFAIEFSRGECSAGCHMRRHSARPRALHAEQCGFRIGEVSEPGAVRSAEIFWHCVGKKPTNEPANWTIGIDNGQRPPAPGEIAADRPRKANKVVEVAAIDQLRARDETPHAARAEYKRIGLVRGDAPQADASELG